MPCPHKFLDYLSFEKIDFEPKVLIVGTFNPAWPAGNYAEWFYGRTSNNYFWDLLPRMFDDAGLRSQDAASWKQYCNSRKVALTDLLLGINDAEEQNKVHHKILGSYTDSALAIRFSQQLPNPIRPILQANPSIRSVYLTTTNGSTFWQSLWQSMENYCIDKGIYCRKLMTPSKGARFLMTKGSGIKMPDFIYNDWKAKWNHNQLLQPTKNS